MARNNNQRKWLQVARAILCQVVVLLPVVATSGVRPSNGDLYYNGLTFVDSLFIWTNPGPFPEGFNPISHTMRGGYFFAPLLPNPLLQLHSGLNR